MYVGAFFAGISPIVQITCAETVDELNDISESVGGGAGLGITFSIEGVHLVDPSYPNDDFQGVQVSLPIGAWGIGFDAHLATANTETI